MKIQFRQYSRLLLLGLSLTTTACDILYVKKISLIHQKVGNSQYHDEEKSVFLEIIDAFVSDLKMECDSETVFIRKCHKPPYSIIVYEDKLEIIACLYMLGVRWEKEKFLQNANHLKKKFEYIFNSNQMIYSTNEELVDCRVLK